MCVDDNYCGDGIKLLIFLQEQFRGSDEDLDPAGCYG